MFRLESGKNIANGIINIEERKKAFNMEIEEIKVTEGLKKLKKQYSKFFADAVSWGQRLHNSHI